MIDKSMNRRFSPRGAFRLVLAGRLLQLRGTRIRAEPGESYPHAVLTIIQSLPNEVQGRLKSEVDFLESLGVYGAPSDVIRRRWEGILGNETEK